MFDIRIGKAYQDFEYVQKVCVDNQLNIVPVIGEIREITYGECITSLDRFNQTLVNEGEGGLPEGIVYKFEPVLLNKYGERLIFKVKFKDFKEEKDEGSVVIPIKLDNKPIRVKRKWGQYPAKYIPSVVDIMNKLPYKLKDLIPRHKNDDTEWKNN